MEQCINWKRTSTREQAESGFSLESQDTLLSSYKRQCGFKLMLDFSIPESASGKQERVEFQKMLDYLNDHSEIKHLLCEKVDRITRNFKDAIKLDTWLSEDETRKIHFVKQSLIIHKNAKSHEKFQWDIYLALARQYANNLSEEAKKGLLAKAAAGHYPGNKKRGYKTIEMDGKKVWIQDPAKQAELKFIKKAFELFDSEAHTLTSLSKKLFAEGWSDRSGKRLAKSSLHNILTACFYCREFTWNDVHYMDAKHVPLISKALFYSVQGKLSRGIEGKYTKHRYLFGNGLMQCQECGRSVVGEIQKGTIYYHCTRHSTDCKQRKYTPESQIDEQIKGVFESFEIRNKRLLEWVQKALKETHKSETTYHLDVLKSLKSNYIKIQRRLDSLYEDKIDGVVTKADYVRRSEKYSKQLDDLLESIKTHKKANISYMELGSNIFELAQRSREIYEEKASMEQKRKLMRLVFSNLELLDGNVVPTYSKAFSIVAEHAKTGDWQGRRDSNPQ